MDIDSFRFSVGVEKVNYSPEQSRVILKEMGGLLEKLLVAQGKMDDLPELAKLLLVGWGESEEIAKRPRRGACERGVLLFEEPVEGTEYTRSIYRENGGKCIEASLLTNRDFAAIAQVMIPIDGNLNNMTGEVVMRE